MILLYDYNIILPIKYYHFNIINNINLYIILIYYLNYMSKWGHHIKCIQWRLQ